jgi:hypothetical protein
MSIKDFKTCLLKTGEEKEMKRSVKKEKLSERGFIEQVFFF